MKDLPYRQIHLDFHTSPLIPDVGCAFDAEAFVRTLKDAHVQSINLFARCHHGFSYYPTKVGRMHPSLSFDLFGGQLAAVRAAGMRALAYTTAAWSEDTCDRHPEWMQLSPEGVLGSKPPFNDGFGNLTCRAWRALCLNQPGYVQYMRRELREINDLYHPDGFWIDIIHQYECVCPVCRTQMLKLGLDPRRHEDRIRFGAISEKRFIRETYQVIKALGSDLAAYFNAAPAAFDRGDETETTGNTKRLFMDFIDIESLPSQEWGYSHFPVLVNFVNKYAQDICMMNGKFHQSWGDFGSLRNKAQLEYECFRALANGARVCVGDQLHPRGRLDPTAYERIGAVFACVKSKEPWCVGTRKVATVGVLAPNRTLENELVAAGGHRADNCSEGVYRVLSESHIPFDFFALEDSIDGYDLIILPEKIRLDGALKRRIDEYVARGGKCLTTGVSGLAYEDGAQALFDAPADWAGMTPYSRPYIRVETAQFAQIPPMDYVLNMPCANLTPAPGAQVLAWYVNPYFDRTWEHTCSHRQTPPDAPSAYAAVVRKGNVIAVGPALFTDYAQYGTQAHKAILTACIHRLLDDMLPIRCPGLPSTAEVTLRQRDGDLIVHVLHYIPHRRCSQMDTIEDVIPLRDVTLAVQTPQMPERIALVPENTPLAFAWEGGYAHFTVPEVNGHQMIWIHTRRTVS